MAIKPHRYPTYPSEWLHVKTNKTKHLTTPTVGDDVEQLELSYIAYGDLNWNTTLKNCLAKFTKEKQAYPVNQVHTSEKLMCLSPKRHTQQCPRNIYSS